MTVQQFEGASAIVSGGAGGLGEATVRRLHADGLGVVIADLAADKGKALADELGSRAVFVSTDVTSEDSIRRAVEQANQLGQGQQYPIKLAAAAIMTIPVAVMFFIFQRQIMNTSEGAVKG